MSEAADNVASMPKRSTHAPLSQVKTLQDAFDHPMFLARLKQATPKHLSPDRMLAVCIQSVQKTPKLRDCSLMSLLGAFVSLASVGLEPNTALGHAYLIPFDKRGKLDNGKWGVIRTDVQVIFGYQGLLDLTYRSGLLRSVHADVVWPGDEFDYHYGTGGQLRHRPRGRLIGTDGQPLAREQDSLPDYAYMHANLKDGGESFEVLPIADVLAIRNATQAYQSAMRALQEAQEKNYRVPATYTEAPWVKFFVPMARKTALRHGSKWLPKSIEAAAALALDEMQERRSANFGAVIEGKADMLTGLDPLPDADEDFGLGGTPTGYSQQEDRPSAQAQTQQQAPEPAQERQPPQRQERKPRASKAAAPAQEQAAPQAATQPAQAQPPAFEAYLLDETGEPTNDAYTDPVLFAQGFARLHELADDRTLLAEVNADGIEAASAFESARAILESLAEPGPADPQQGSDEDPTAEIPMERSGRGPDLTGWVKAAAGKLAELTTPQQVMAWIGNNEHVWRPFPASRRLEVEKAVTERAAAFGLKWSPPPAPARQQAAASPAPDAETGKPQAEQPDQAAEARAFIDRMKRQGDEQLTEAGLNSLASRNATELSRISREHPALYRELGDHFTARREALKGSGASETAGG